MALVVIPARWASSRLEHKPLVTIAGRPMIEHVYRRAAEASGVERVVVATDNEEIASVVKAFGGEAILTGECETGTDRVARAARRLGRFGIIVNVQGDEPLIPPEMIEQVIEPLKNDSGPGMASLKRAFREDENPSLPQLVKVVTDLEDNALYFSRSLIPYPRNPGESGPYLHVGIYAFRAETLFQFTSLPRTPLERAESLEQLRALEHGIKIAVPTTSHYSVGVDTQEDLEKVRSIMEP